VSGSDAGADRPVHLLGFAGSLREKSLNRALLRAAVRLCPAGATIETFDLRGIPVYDEDLRLSRPPEHVTLLKERVAAADGVLICTPEYNNGVPGVVKNAVDWVSRPPDTSPWTAKPVGLMGATDGPWGTVRSQQQLRLAFVSTGSYVMVRPQIYLPHANLLIDDAGDYSDEATLRRVGAFMTAFVAWARMFREAAAATR
jgi:chromate reductase, NAD(P)H dehydrogenase (quinone)